MERRVTVYARRADPVSVDAVQERMRQRGLPVRWKAAPLTDALGTVRWISGHFISEEHPNALVAAARDTLSPDARREALTDLGAALRPEHREALLAAEVSYGLETDGTDETVAERMLLFMADIFAEQGNGVIVDATERASYDLAAFRARHASDLGAG
jgi:hypothetical protein